VLDLELLRSESAELAAVPITYSVNGTRTADKVTISGQSYRFKKRLPLGKLNNDGHGFVSVPSDTNLRTMFLSSLTARTHPLRLTLLQKEVSLQTG